VTSVSVLCACSVLTTVSNVYTDWLSAKCHQDSLLQLCSLQFIAVCTWKHLCTAFVHWIIFWQWPFDIANNRRGIHTCSPQWQNECYCLEFLADRTNGRAYATVLRLSSSDLDLCLEVISRSRQPLRYIRRWISRKPLEIEAWLQRTTNRKWHVGYRMVMWPMKSRHVTLKGQTRA